MIKQSKLLKIKSQILSYLFNEKYGLKERELNNITEIEELRKCRITILCHGRKH